MHAACSLEREPTAGGGSGLTLVMGSWDTAALELSSTWALRRALILEAGPPGRFDRYGRPLGPRKAAEFLG
jgi:hypothetical protein